MASVSGPEATRAPSLAATVHVPVVSSRTSTTTTSQSIRLRSRSTVDFTTWSRSSDAGRVWATRCSETSRSLASASCEMRSRDCEWRSSASPNRRRA